MQIVRRTLLLSALALASATPVLAQETMRVRGTVEKLDGSILSVKTREGAALSIALDKPVFVAMVKAAIADIKPGTYVGATGLPADDGSLRAVEIHIFPEAMRGTGEGHRPWDLQAGSTMTNANVEMAVTGVKGAALTLKYKDGEKKLVVTPETVIVTYAPGDAAEVKSGTKIFISAAAKKPDGGLTASRISYGRDGLTPPM